MEEQEIIIEPKVDSAQEFIEIAIDINIIKKEDFGKKRIDTVRISDAKEWLIKLQDMDGRGYSSIHSIRGVVRPAFQMAVEDVFQIL